VRRPLGFRGHCHVTVTKPKQSGSVSTIQDCRDLRAASLQQARALRAAILRQTSASIIELMQGEAERLEALADECRRQIDHVQDSARA
jgi:acetylornithine/succinyldiaminopimelate/putrescine aminotransferase